MERKDGRERGQGEKGVREWERKGDRRERERERERDEQMGGGGERERAGERGG